jgi:hypothetical protein
MIPYGKLRLIQIIGAAAQLNVALQPDAGYRWTIISAWGYSNNIDIPSWSWKDGTLTLTPYTALASIAATARLPLNFTSVILVSTVPVIIPNVVSPVVASHTVYPNYSVVTGNTSTLTVEAVVLEYAEV